MEEIRDPWRIRSPKVRPWSPHTLTQEGAVSKKHPCFLPLNPESLLLVQFHIGPVTSSQDCYSLQMDCPAMNLFFWLNHDILFVVTVCGWCGVIFLRLFPRVLYIQNDIFASTLNCELEVLDIKKTEDIVLSLESL